ncbi:acyl carrier protein [Yoonia maricola]|uniref:Acyl carrier protein n=1 Tax=Yoonia maricola TaxID=420999 RepID=A0A2M8WNV3_9RHOB|nr:acyl carrier protein [Yoonia maricola]PJI92583.1 acyl carrier protein [Yoonia maricola]
MPSETFALVAEALNISPDKVTVDTSLMTTSEWDSLAHFRMVLAVEERLGRPLDPMEITTLVDVTSVARIIEADRPETS